MMNYHCAFAAGRMAVIFSAVAVIGCRQATPNRVRIISSLPRTGVSREVTESIVRGIRLAIEDARGRAGRFEVEYLDLDNATAATGRWTSEGEAANARRAAQDPEVMAYLGPLNSGAARISMPILNYADLLMVSPANTAVGLTKPGLGMPGEPAIYRPTGRLNYVRVVPADDIQGPLAATWAYERGLRRIYVVDDGGVYGRGVASLFADRCLELGMQVLDQVSIDPQASDFKTFVASVMRADPDMIYFGGTTRTKGGQLARDLAGVGCEAVLLVPDGCFDQAFIDAAGVSAVEGRCFATVGGLPPEQFPDHGRFFLLAYQKRYGSLPDASAVYGYESMRLVLAAIAEVARKDRRAISDAALATRDFDGLLGRWSVDANGDTTLRQLSVYAVRDGQFVFDEMIITTGMGDSDDSR